MTKDELNLIYDFLCFLTFAGCEVVKSNSEQIAANNKNNQSPIVVANDIHYLTPNPYDWFEIESEKKRIKNMLKGLN